jgi:hypothetical protein
MTCSEDGLTECRKIQFPVRIGNGHMLIATKIGKKQVTVVQRDGTITELVLTNCKYVPKLFTNLFSITAAIKLGWNISNQGQEIQLTKSSMMIAFDHLLKTEHGQIPAIAMVPRQADPATVRLEHGTTADINVMHAVLGHANEDTIMRTAFIIMSNLQVLLSSVTIALWQKQSRNPFPNRLIMIGRRSVWVNDYTSILVL